MYKIHEFRTVFVSVLFLALAAPTVVALDPPDSEVNPSSGDIETVQTNFLLGNYFVLHVVDPGSGGPQATTIVSNHADDDLNPRLTISPAGDTWAAWSRDGSTGEVWIRKHDYSTDTWETAERVSVSGTHSSNPELVHDGTDPWVAFEADNTVGGVDITVLHVNDDPDPVLSLGTTSYSGDLDVKIHFVSGSLWVTWVDADCDVGWSRHTASTGTWSAAEYESCASDSVADARARVRSEVLGL